MYLHMVSIEAESGSLRQLQRGGPSLNHSDRLDEILSESDSVDYLEKTAGYPYAWLVFPRVIFARPYLLPRTLA